MKISLFKNSYAEKPEQQIKFEDFVEHIKEGTWEKPVEKLRSLKGLDNYRKFKEALPCVTISGEYRTRDKFVKINKRLIRHSGLICLDVDRKDNPKMRVKDLVDKECLMQYISCSGEGLKIVYRCTSTRDPAVHRRIYDAAVKRLESAGIKLKIDPIVKNIASLQYVSFDPQLFYFPKTKLVIKPLPAIKRKKSSPSADQEKDIAQMEEFIEALGEKDVTENYENWLTIGMGLSYSLGESGRPLFHKLSKNYENYSKDETDEKFDGLLERDPNSIERPVTLASIYQIIYDALPKKESRRLAKKYNVSHAVGIGEDVEGGEQTDLVGLVRYRLFLFKKVIDKKTSEVIELVIHKINLNAFETLLRGKGFFRYGEEFVHIVDNIVERVDKFDILRIVTQHIESDGDYIFIYKNTEFKFSWEDIAHTWREVRGQGTTFNQLASSLQHWVPNLLSDNKDHSYIPYRNGVLQVSPKSWKIIKYESIKQQIWKDQILPRDFKYVNEVGMFEEFFANVCGRGTTRKERIAHEAYKRAQWYFGYMLHGFKRKSTARAWILYDIKAGNNGRTGKTIIGQALSKLRNVAIIDGKQVDFTNNRFALQKVSSSTKIVLIDDVRRNMSLAPLFNMITGTTDTERKNEGSVEMDLKFMMTSNFIMEVEERSEQGRQFISQLDDFYARHAEKTGTLTPIVDIHGKEFFTDWNDKEWNQLDTFAVKCLQSYMGKEAPNNNIVGNVNIVRFHQQYGDDLFFELSHTLAENVKLAKDGSIFIVQKLVIQTIKDASDFSNNTKAGKIAKEFLRCISGTVPGRSTVFVANMRQMAYTLNKKWSDLDFGEDTKNLPKPKL